MIPGLTLEPAPKPPENPCPEGQHLFAEPDDGGYCLRCGA